MALDNDNDNDNELKRDLGHFYTKAQLQKGFLPYIKRILPQLSQHLSHAKVQKITEKKVPTKEALVDLIASVLSDQKLFLSFKSALKEEVQKLLDILIWEGSLLHEDLIQEEYGIVIGKKSNYGWRDKSNALKDEFYLFAIHEEYDWRHGGSQFYIILPPGIKKSIMDSFDKPEGYYLQPVKETPDKLLVFRGEETIFQELPRLLVYKNQGNIKLTTSGVPVVSTFSKMRKSLSIREFSEKQPKPYDSLRTSLLGTLISGKEATGSEKKGLDMLAALFHYFQHDFYPLHLLNYLKGINRLDDWDKLHTGTVLWELLDQLPGNGSWISLENLHKFARFRIFPLYVAHLYPLSRYVYYPDKEHHYTYNGKVYVGQFNIDQLVTIPLLKASFFLYAAFGLVDAAYEQPEGNDQPKGMVKSDSDLPSFPTPYDGLRYVRLTPLGAYLLGRQDTYTEPQAADKTNIQLLNDSLHILSDKPDETIDLLLENFTVKVGPVRYKTDFSIFMKGIKNKKELEAKIDMFRQVITDNLPPNWQSFFETLRLKCKPLKSIGAHMAYQLSQEDKELIQLIAKDPVLKKVVAKAEGLIILVMKKDLAKFKARLKEFGYMLD